MKKFFASLLGGVSGYLAAAAVGAALAGFAVYAAQELRLDASALKAENAERREQTALTDLGACREATQRQNEAVARAELRAKAARDAMDAANVDRDNAEAKAEKILGERTPANVDRCVAAREAFANELRQERGQ